MTSPTIRPARGLWAAVSPEGLVNYRTISWAATFSRKYAAVDNDWSDLAAIGWRIIRVDVIPHEEGKDVE